MICYYRDFQSIKENKTRNVYPSTVNNGSDKSIKEMTNIPKPIEKSKTANIIETNGFTKDWKLRKSKIKNLIYLIMKTFSFCYYLKVEK